MGALTRTPTPPHRETVGSIESMSASGEMRGSRVITGLSSGLKYPYLHPFYTCLNPCNVGVRYPVHRDPQIRAHRSIPHDNGLGDHGSTTENSLKISANGQNFPRLRRAKRGFAYGTVPDSPGSATPSGTLIPVRFGAGAHPRNPISFSSLWVVGCGPITPRSAAHLLQGTFH